MRRANRWVFILAGGAFALDQASKFWVSGHQALFESRPWLALPGRLGMSLTYVVNDGAAFSMMRGRMWLLSTLAIAIAVYLLVFVRRHRLTSGWQAGGIGLLLAGTLGNLSDRLFRSDHGAVIDFVDLHVWPVFNVADSAITIGCILLVISLFRAPRNR